MSEPNLCGCGNPVRYIVPGGPPNTGACNKYARCPTYEELSKRFQILRDLNEQALVIINDAILHGMPITPEVAAVQNGLRGIEVTTEEKLAR